MTHTDENDAANECPGIGCTCYGNVELHNLPSAENDASGRCVRCHGDLGWYGLHGVWEPCPDCDPPSVPPVACDGSFACEAEAHAEDCYAPYVLPPAADWDTAFPPIRPHACHIELGALYAGQRDPDCAGCRCIPPGECRTCEGEGVVPSPDPDPSVVTSRLPDQRCPECGGTGEEH